MSTFSQAVRAALDEIDPHAGKYVDHWRITDPDKLTESILVHLTAWALAKADAEEGYEKRAGWSS